MGAYVSCAPALLRSCAPEQLIIRFVSIILASASPRRAELLTAAGISFLARPVDVDETRLPTETAEACARRLARAKAEAVARPPGAIVLGADTLVVIDGDPLGKPVDDGEAAAMLRRLSGRTHEVVTGVALLHDAGADVDLVSTSVTFERLSEREIAWYVATGEPRDKAGAYGIQGGAARFISRIDGSYSNVVGLPVELVYRRLRALVELA
jgi:septum formation protein